MSTRTPPGTRPYDRTLGIPHRSTTMWPNHRGSPHWRPADPHLANDIAGQLRQHTEENRPVRAPIATLTAALSDLSVSVVGQPLSIQARILHRVAVDHGLDSVSLTLTAMHFGDQITQAGPPPDPNLAGNPRLNALAGANIPLAVEARFATTGLRDLIGHSPPDLPRLWILANGLANRVDATTMLTVPAASQGPAARIIATHDDLIGWHAAGDALDRIDTLIVAAQIGRNWIEHGDLRSIDHISRAIGVIDLTHPTVARELAAIGPTHLSAGAVRAAVRGLPIPDTAVDLTDQALEAACERAGWLLGDADEHTHREIINRAVDAGWTDKTRRRLAHGDPDALTAILDEHGPDDDALKAATPPAYPPQGPRTLDAIGTYLGATSRHAIEHFTGYAIPDPPSRAVAIATRFPDPALLHHLALTAADLRPLEPENDPDPPGSLTARRSIDLNPEYDPDFDLPDFGP